jgi:hypothetical protein
MPQTPGPKRIGDGNGDGQVNQSDLIVLNQILNGAQASSGQRAALDLAKPCGQLTEKDRKALQKALDKLAKGKKAPKAKCHGKTARVGDPLASPMGFTGHRGTMSGVREDLRVRVWTLAGNLILESELQAGAGWQRVLHHLQSHLPNGVYLYRATAYSSEGQVIRSDVHKLIILR